MGGQLLRRSALLAALGLALCAAAPANGADSTVIKVPPAVTGEANVGSTLTASPGEWDPPRATPSYQWLRCPGAGTDCTPIEGEQSLSHTVAPADAGSALAIALTVTRGSLTATAQSAPSAVVPVPPTPPVMTAAPVIAGTARIGELLSGTEGAWSGSQPVAFSAEWLRCDQHGAACSTASSGFDTYRLGAPDVGFTLRFAVLATNVAGSARATSAPTAVVAPLREDTAPASAGAQPQAVTTGDTINTGGGATGLPLAGGGAAVPLLMRPFPIVRIGGRFTPRATTFTRFAVRAPAAARIRVRCTGSGCPFAKRSLKGGPVRLGALQRAFRPRVSFELRITAPDVIGKYTRITVRSGRSPARIDSCLFPGRREPASCPAA